MIQLDELTDDWKRGKNLIVTAAQRVPKSGGFADVKFVRQGDGLRIIGSRTGLSHPGMAYIIHRVLRLGGRFTLKIDGKPFHTADAKEWWNAAAVKPYGPDAKQYEKLRAAVVAKNQLYFYSWRPQNTTYLFGFRKHEQGQNAKEIAEFAKLVADKEREIDRLKKPVSRTYELIRVKKGNK